MPAFQKKWLLWRYVTASDTDLANIHPSTDRTWDSGVIQVRAWDEIAARSYVNADAQTATLHVYGWMDNGPVLKLGNVAAVGGVEAITAALPLEDDPRFPLGTYTEVDDYTITGNQHTLVAPEASLGNITRQLLIPTKNLLYLQVIIVLGTATTCGIIWRPSAYSEW